MNAPLYKHVQIPVEKKIKTLPPIPPNNEIYTHIRLSKDDVTDEMLDWLESVGFKPRTWCNPILFYAHAGGRTSVHTDGGGPQIWALNCALDPNAKIEVRWHDTSQSDSVSNSDDLRYNKYDDSSPIIERTMIQNTACHIAVPHSSVNFGDGCWLLSLRIYPSSWMNARRIF